MNRYVPLLSVVLSLLSVPAWAQFKDQEGDSKGASRGASQTQRWQFGIQVTATGPCSNLVGYVPVPANWPEQQVAAVHDEISPAARVHFEVIDGVKLMLVEIQQLAAGEQAKALVTYEIRKQAQIPPKDTSIYSLPDLKKLPSDIKPWLGSSPPYIDSRGAKIRAALKQAIGDKERAWEKVEAIYDWVRGQVKVKKGPAKGAVVLLRELDKRKDAEADTEDWGFLFISLCRAANVPARTVWVPGHCYAEFYLVDDEGNGHWFPCEMTGNRAFGGIADPRPVIEKGDNFHSLANRRDRQRFLKEYLTASGTIKPQAKFFRSPVAQ